LSRILLSRRVCMYVCIHHLLLSRRKTNSSDKNKQTEKLILHAVRHSRLSPLKWPSLSHHRHRGFSNNYPSENERNNSSREKSQKKRARRPLSATLSPPAARTGNRRPVRPISSTAIPRVPRSSTSRLPASPAAPPTSSSRRIPLSGDTAGGKRTWRTCPRRTRAVARAVASAPPRGTTSQYSKRSRHRWRGRTNGGGWRSLIGCQQSWHRRNHPSSTRPSSSSSSSSSPPSPSPSPSSRIRRRS